MTTARKRASPAWAPAFVEPEGALRVVVTHLKLQEGPPDPHPHAGRRGPPILVADPSGLPCVNPIGTAGNVICTMPKAVFEAEASEAIDARGAVTKAAVAAKGYTRFNLIAHSQGGPTARYVAGVAADASALAALVDVLPQQLARVLARLDLAAAV